MCRMRRFKDIPPIVWIQRRWYGQDLDLPVSSISSYSTGCQAELRWNRPLIRQQVKPRNVCQNPNFMRKKNIHDEVLYTSYMQTQRIHIYFYLNGYRTHLYLQVSRCHTHPCLTTLSYYYCIVLSSNPFEKHSHSSVMLILNWTFTVWFLFWHLNSVA